MVRLEALPYPVRVDVCNCVTSVVLIDVCALQSAIIVLY